MRVILFLAGAFRSVLIITQPRDKVSRQDAKAQRLSGGLASLREISSFLTLLLKHAADHSFAIQGFNTQSGADEISAMAHDAQTHSQGGVLIGLKFVAVVADPQNYGIFAYQRHLDVAGTAVFDGVSNCL